jgi:hypothetical protein
MSKTDSMQNSTSSTNSSQIAEVPSSLQALLDGDIGGTDSSRFFANCPKKKVRSSKSSIIASIDAARTAKHADELKASGADKAELIKANADAKHAADIVANLKRKQEQAIEAFELRKRESKTDETQNANPVVEKPKSEVKAEEQDKTEPKVEPTSAPSNDFVIPPDPVIDAEIEALIEKTPQKPHKTMYYKVENDSSFKFDADSFKEFFDFEEIRVSPKSENVAVFCSKKMSVQYYKEHFVDFYNSYMKRKISKGDFLVDKFNVTQVSKAMNCIYLDCDYHLDCEDAENINAEIINEYLEFWTQELERNKYKFDYYMFLPTEFPNKKYGGHVQVFCDKIVGQDALEKMYEDIIQRDMKDWKLLEKLPEEERVHLRSTFDKQPIKSRTLLLPFARKDPKSRLYKMYDCDNRNGFFVIPTLKLPSDIADKQTEAKDKPAKTRKFNITREDVDKIVSGLTGLEIHNSASGSIKDEVSLLPLFDALNSLAGYVDDLDAVYEQVKSENKLTEKAAQNWDQMKESRRGKCTNPFVLKNIIKVYNEEYYNAHFRSTTSTSFEEGTVTIHKIDLKEEFDFYDLIYQSEMYKTKEAFLSDLTKVMRYVDGDAEDLYLVKQYNILDARYVIRYKSERSIHQKLRMMILKGIVRESNQNSEKSLTGWDIYLENNKHFYVRRGVRFFSTNENEFSLWQGWKYKKLERIDFAKINGWLEMVFAVVAGNNTELFIYVLKWVAHILQKVGKKTAACLILKGLQGVGKGRFTDIIAELTSGYSASNINKMDEVTGNFNAVLLSKVFLVLNEIKNVGEEKNANYDNLKSIITDPSYTINEKNVPRFEAENVNNVVVVTNHNYPVRVEASDRRYVVCDCKTKYMGKLDYWKALSDGMDEAFYDNLFTFFMSLDLSNFNPREIPANEAKNDLIRVGRSSTDDVIVEHFELFKQGLRCGMIDNWLPKDLKLKTFQHNLLEKCDKVQKKEQGKHVWYYVLKKEYYSVFETLMAGRDKDDSDLDETEESENTSTPSEETEETNTKLFQSILKELVPEH